MKILKASTSPRYKRQEDAITSYLLASSRTSGANNLTVTLVEIEPEGRQKIHRHEPEQMYFILEGSGQMTVGEETNEVRTGDCIFIPSNTPHGLENTADKALKYLSAAAPGFTNKELEALWPLPSEAEQS